VDKMGVYKFNGRVCGVETYGFLRRLVRELEEISKKEKDGAVEGMKEVCLEAGMEGFEEQLERILKGVETAVLRDSESRGCLDRAGFEKFWKMDWEMV
jgi:hypothetical protein